MKVPKVDIQVSNTDKWGHSFAYFTLSICWLFAFYKFPKKKYLVILSCIIYGIIIEIFQDMFTTHRMGDYLDAIANTLGVLAGLLVFNQIVKKINVN